MYRLKNKGTITNLQEYWMAGRLIAVIFFGSYVNFNHLQYHTDFYLRKYAYRTQQKLIEKDMSLNDWNK